MCYRVRLSFRPWGPLIAACIVTWSTAAWTAEESSVRPGANRPYLRADMNVVEWVKRFEGESREIFALRHAIADAVGIEAGYEVADVGAGTGLFVPLFVQRTGTAGHVFALDIAPKFAAYIRDRVDEAGLTGVSVVLSRNDRFPCRRTRSTSSFCATSIITSNTRKQYSRPSAGPCVHRDGWSS